MPRFIWSLTLFCSLIACSYWATTSWLYAPYEIPSEPSPVETPITNTLKPQKRYQVTKEIYRSVDGVRLLSKLNSPIAILENSDESGHLVERLDKPTLFIQNPPSKNSKGTPYYPLYAIKAKSALWNSSTSLFSGKDVHMQLFHLQNSSFPTQWPTIQAEWESQSQELLIDLKRPTDWQVHAKRLKANFFSLMLPETDKNLSEPTPQP